MPQKQKKQQSKKGAPSSAKSGSQKNHQASHHKNPEKLLRRIIRSSGFSEAQRWADKFGGRSHLVNIQEKMNADGQKVEVLWIARKKEESGLLANAGYIPVHCRTGRALRPKRAKVVVAPTSS